MWPNDRALHSILNRVIREDGGPGANPHTKTFARIAWNLLFNLLVFCMAASDAPLLVAAAATVSRCLTEVISNNPNLAPGDAVAMRQVRKTLQKTPRTLHVT